MNDNQKFNRVKFLDTKARDSPAMRPRLHNRNNLNPTVVMDPKLQPKPDMGSQPHDLNNFNPTVVVDTKSQTKPAMGPPPHDQKINPTVVKDTKVQPKPTVAHRLHEQKIGPLGADPEAQPLAHNLRANTSQPYIRITPKHNKIATPHSGKHGFKTCICWTIGLIFLLLLILGATVGIIYLVFRPKIPNYSVDSLSISDLRLNLDLSLYAKFDVKITATNPNKKIGIYYRKGSKLSVWYSKTKLCQGTLPKFYQGHQNTTKLDVALTGQNQYGSTLMAALQQQQQTGRIPLDLKIDVPVNIELGKLKLRKIRILGTCSLTVDNLSANSFITIKASTCKFGAKL